MLGATEDDNQFRVCQASIEADAARSARGAAYFDIHSVPRLADEAVKRAEEHALETQGDVDDETIYARFPGLGLFSGVRKDAE